MDAMPYTTIRQNLASAMDRVCQDREAIVITRQKSDSVVMMSLEEYEALEETAFLLRAPRKDTRRERVLSPLPNHPPIIPGWWDFWRDRLVVPRFCRQTARLCTG